jgi:hypothetical protein
MDITMDLLIDLKKQIVAFDREYMALLKSDRIEDAVKRDLLTERTRLLNKGYEVALKRFIEERG